MEEKEERLLSLRKVIERISKSKSWIYSAMSQKKFPKSRKIGRSTVWISSEIDDFVEKVKSGGEA